MLTRKSGNRTLKVSIICLDATNRNYNIWGTAEIIESGPLFDEVAAAMAAMNLKPKLVAKVKVEEIETK